MSFSPRYQALIAVLLLAACGDSPTEPVGDPTVEFEIVAPRSTVLPPFVATRRGHELTMFGTITTPCAPFDATGEAWHEDDTLFVEFSFVGQDGCEVGNDVSYTALVTAAGGSSRLRIIHGWPASGEAPDTVFRAVFRVD